MPKTKSSRPLSGREIAGVLLLLIVLLACAFPGTFLRGEVIAPGEFGQRLSPWDNCGPNPMRNPSSSPLFDMYSYYFPVYRLVRNALNAGEWPLWNHLEAGGIPLLADAQSAVFYPPRLLFQLFDDIVAATTVFTLLKLVLCGLTAYLCARGLGLHVAPSLFLGVGWLLSSYSLTYPSWLMADVCAWVPLLFLGIERMLGRRYQSGLALTFLGGTLILLAGHPETAFTMGVGLGIYLVFRLAAEQPSGRDTGCILGCQSLAWGFALLVSAAQLLPLFEYFTNSLSYDSRADSALFEKTFTFGTLVATWVPRFFGSGAEDNVWGSWDKLMINHVYLGVVPWLFASLLLGHTARRGPGARRALCLAMAAACCLLMALGVPPFELVKYLPFFSAVRSHLYLAFFLFAMPLLAAFALDDWIETRPSLRDLRWPGAVFALLAAATVVTYCMNRSAIADYEMTDYVVRKMIFAGAVGLACLILVALCVRCGKPGWFVGLAAVLLAADLIATAHGVNRTAPRAEVMRDTPFTECLQSLDPPGIVSTRSCSILPGILANLDVEQYRGYDALLPKRWPGFMSLVEAHGAVARYIVADSRFGPGTSSRNERLGDFGCLHVYRNTNALPEAFLLGDVEVVGRPESILEHLREKRFEPGPVALVEQPLGVTLPGGALDGLGEARVTRRTSTQITLAATASQSAVLVLLRGYYPGWKAWVDDTPTDVFPVFYAFRGIVLPEGEHTVIFRYEPASFRWGLILSVASLCIACVAGLVVLVMRKRPARSVH